MIEHLGVVVTIICGASSVLCSIGTAFFVYGRLTEKVKGNERRTTVLESTVARHEGEIGELYGISRATRPPL